MWKGRVVWPGLDFDRGVGIEIMFTQRHELLSFLDVESKTFLISKTRDGQAPVKE